MSQKSEEHADLMGEGNETIDFIDIYASQRPREDIHIVTQYWHGRWTNSTKNTYNFFQRTAAKWELALSFDAQNMSRHEDITGKIRSTGLYTY
jgi:hypothetical protein